MREKEFKERLKKAQKELLGLEKSNNRFINYRLFVFLTGAILVGLLFYKKNQTLAFSLSILFILLFILVVVTHGRIKRNLKRCRALADIYVDHLKRINGEWTDFSDTGDEFLTDNHPYAADLNIFGVKSLFQMLNLTHTFKGRTRFADLLGRPDTDHADILKRQGAVEELSGKLDFIEEFTLEGQLIKKPSMDPENLIEAIRSKVKVPGILKSPVILFGLPGMTLLSASFAGKNFPWLYFTLLSGLMLQLLIFGWSYKILSSHLGKVSKYKDELETYKKLFELIEKEQFSSELLKDLQGRMTSKSSSAADEIKRLARISDFIDFKNTPIIYFIMNVLFLWDLHLNKSLDRWKADNAENIMLWLDALGAFEALISLSVMEVITPVSSYPTFTFELPEFHAKDLAHPFIHHEKRVSNNVDINGISIITGSNMSGKTTLLRTIGINLVLAYAGAPVCASSLRTEIMTVYTSMRNNDDLSEGVSTFYAELLRIKKIVDYSKQQEKMIFLIDEIFKGTNSKDRVDGAKTVLKGLDKPWMVGLISTHDYELCDLENDSNKRFSNYHFTENYSENRIHFDYKLHKGRCKTSNARYLMKMVGLE